MYKAPTSAETEMNALDKQNFNEIESTNQASEADFQGACDKQLTQKYLTLLAENVDEFTFQTFDDNKARADKSLANIIHGTLDQHFDKLYQLNSRGAGIFVTVNETDLSGRKVENIKDVRAIFQEADRQGVPIPTLSPHIVVETSLGKFHRYWLTHGGGNSLNEFKFVMTTMVNEYGSDPNARDLARVLRLPGFYHLKDPSKPFMVQIVESSNAQPYTWEQIKTAIPPTPISEKEQTPPNPAGRFQKRLFTESALNKIGPDCDYQMWLTIGMALHHASNGGIGGFSLWDEWSKKGASYRQGETAYKWSTFGDNSGPPVTIGTIFHHASQHGWKWDSEHKHSVLKNAISIVEYAIVSVNDDAGAYLNEDFKESLGIINACDSLMYEQIRNRMKEANPKVRTSTLDKFARSGSAGVESDSPAAELVRLTCERCELWHDSEGRGYASFEQEYEELIHQEHWEINSSGFGEWLARLAHAELNVPLSAETLNTVKNTLNGKAKFDGAEYLVFRRVGKNDMGYWIDLGDGHWQAVCVTPAGWSISSSPMVRFVRGATARPLPMPLKDGTETPLWELLNIPAEDQSMVLAWILECYRCDTPYPLLEITGEQGSAKSSNQTLLRSLIDPNEVMLRGRPKTVDDIYVSAKNNHLLSFENLSSITSEMSDALCTVSTGGGTAGRTLYTNTEETILKAHNPIILNGIGAVVLRQDLLDRTIGTCLPVIEKRRTEQELQQAVLDQLPKIFGGILTLFADTLATLPTVEIPADELPRMADFAMLGEAMFRALGNDQGGWLTAYRNHRKNSVRRTIDSSVVAVCCLKLIDSGESYKGTVKGLLERLNAIKETRLEQNEYWPKSPRGLGDQLRRIAPSMRLVGVYLSVDNKPMKDGVHCRLEKIDGVYDF